MFDKKKWRKDYTEKNRGKINKYTRDWRAKNKERYRTSQKKWDLKLRLEVLIHYGGSPPKCACCGELILKFLTLDHINGGGNKQRRKLKIPSGTRFYSWIKKHNFPKGYQVLCMNCNWAKRYSGICPHKEN